MVTWDRKRMPARLSGLALAAALAAGCGGSGGRSGTVGTANPGQMQIMMADDPVDGVEAVNVTLTQIEALYDGEQDSRGRIDDDRGVASAPDTEPDGNDQWVTLSSQPRTFNLLDYANKPFSRLLDLGNVRVPSGHYKRFRFTITAVDVVIAGVRVTPVMTTNRVEVPSECFVSPRENETLVVDFDAGGSVQSDGSTYQFDPQLRMLQQDHSATVSGTVEFQATTPVTNFQARVELLDGAGQVAAHSEVEAASSTPQPMALAPFVIHAVPPGIYSVRVTGEQGFQGVVSAPLPVQAAGGQSVQTGAFALSR
jgi:uncharacterized protein DUF4382